MKAIAGIFGSRRSDLQALARKIDALGTLLPKVLTLSTHDFDRQTRSEAGGYFLFGPRHELPAGRYFAFFWVEVSEGIASPRLVFDAVSWRGDQATTVGVAVHALSAGRSRTAIFPLHFELSGASVVEFRAWSDMNMRTLRGLAIHVHRFNEERLGPDVPLQIFRPTARSPRWRLHRDFEAIANRDPNATSNFELWLAFRSTAGSAQITVTPKSGPASIIELVGIAKAGQFVMKDGRSLLHLAFPPPTSSPIPRECHITVALNGTRIDLGRIERPHGPPPAVEGPAYELRLRATGTRAIEADGTAIRLRNWGIGGTLNQPPIGSWAGVGEQCASFVQLVDQAIAKFATNSSAFFLFQTGPDCGVAELDWGPAHVQIDLFEPSPGLMTVVVPEDLQPGFNRPQVLTLAALQERSVRNQKEDAVEILALGSKHALSRSTEIVIQCIWRDYPLARGSLEELTLKGNFEKREAENVLWRGTARSPVRGLPAVQLLRHDWGGLGAISYRGRFITFDLYARERESILVLPTLDAPVLSSKTTGPLVEGEVVHPALKHLFARMRPSWLDSPTSLRP